VRLTSSHAKSPSGRALRGLQCWGQRFELPSAPLVFKINGLERIKASKEAPFHVATCRKPSLRLPISGSPRPARATAKGESEARCRSSSFEAANPAYETRILLTGRTEPANASCGGDPESRSSRPTLRLPAMRRNRGRRAALSALFWRTALMDNQMIPLGGRYSIIIKALNFNISYLPKLIQLILTLREHEYVGWVALYKCKHSCSKTIYFSCFRSRRSSRSA
jgi:hypothetical protein